MGKYKKLTKRENKKYRRACAFRMREAKTLQTEWSPNILGLESTEQNAMELPLDNNRAETLQTEWSPNILGLESTEQNAIELPLDNNSLNDISARFTEQNTIESPPSLDNERSAFTSNVTGSSHIILDLDAHVAKDVPRSTRKRPRCDPLGIEDNYKEEPLPYEINFSPDNCSNYSDLKITNIEGHRIVDINYFFNELVKISNHESLFQCSLSGMSIISEKRVGFQSTFTLLCDLCKKKFKVNTTTQNLNKTAVAGTVAAGCGNVQLNQFSAALDIPVMSEKTYKNNQDEVFDEWEVTAWEEMKRAGELEKEAALKEGRVTKDGDPEIDVIIDGCWCKRSYKSNYSALSGAAAIIGARFGQVLFMAVKNKYCCVCARAEKLNHVVKSHECYKNFSGSSTMMESTILAEGFKQSLEMHGLVYKRFIADGDSSTYSKILESRPYPSITVEKIGCRNHILRNFCNKLQQLKTDTKYSCAERKRITNQKILCGRKYVCDAIKYHASVMKNKDESIQNLHHDIAKAMAHAFGCHTECNKNFCTEETKTNMPEISCLFIWSRISYILNAVVAAQARSLIEDVDSNVVERFNGVIAKFVGGKRINYALKRSYQARCAGAVVSFNSGKIHTTVQKTIHNKSPHSQMKKYEEKMAGIREYKKTLKRKKNRKLTIPKRIDFDYGENANKPDMDADTFELAKTIFMQNLEKSEKERRDIEKRTILQSECGEWLELRRNLLTASNFGKVVKRIKTNSCANTVKNMLYKQSIDHVASIKHGKSNEKTALEQLSKMKNMEIQECGLFIDEKYPFLGATPDGIVDDMVIEIKCPIAPFKLGIDAAISQGKMHFWRLNKKTGQIIVNQKSDWYIHTSSRSNAHM